MRRGFVPLIGIPLLFLATACTPTDQATVQSGMETAAPTIEAAAQLVGTEVAAGLQTAEPTLAAAGTSVAGAVGTVAADLAVLGSTWSWQTTKMSNDSARTPDKPESYTLKFEQDGTVAIQADCNMVSGTYTADGSQLTIAIGPSTMAACPAGSLSDEYLRDLGDVVSFVLENGTLYLAMKMDAGIMEFAPLP